MLEVDLLPLPRRLHDRQAHLQRRRTPRTGVRERLTQNHRVIELGQLRVPRHVAPFDRHLPLALPVVHVDTVRGVPDVPALAAHDEDAEVVGDPRALLRSTAGLRRLLGTAQVLFLLVLGLVPRAGKQLLPDGGARLRRAPEAIGAPVDELGGIQVAVAVVHEGGRRAVLELEIRRVVAGDRPFRHPLPDHPTHAPHHAPAQDPQRVHLVWRLAEGNAPAERGVQVHRSPGPQHPVGERPNVERAHRAQGSRAQDGERRAGPRGVALGVSAHHRHAAALHGLEHPGRLVHRDRDGLLDDEVLAVLRRNDCVLAVVLVRRGDPERVHVRVGADLLRARVRPTAVPLLERGEPRGAGISGRDQLDVRHGLHGPGDVRTAHAHP